MANYPLYNRLCTRSKKYWFKMVQNPKLLSKVNFKTVLIKRLSEETGMDFDTTYNALLKELYNFVEEKSIKY
jgi:hypothetical protein